MVMGCTFKALCNVKVVGSKPLGQKSINVKGWCGLGWVWTLGDFDELDTLGLRFLKPKVKRVVISGLTQLSKQIYIYIYSKLVYEIHLFVR